MNISLIGGLCDRTNVILLGHQVICQGAYHQIKPHRKPMYHLEAITATWNISIYVHIMDINITASQL